MKRREGRVAIAVLVLVAICTVSAVGAQASRQAQSSMQAASPAPAYKVVGHWGGVGAGHGKFGTNARGLATDAAGNVYVADSNGHQIQVFSAKGAFKTQLAFSSQEFVADVAVGPDGDVFGSTNVGSQVRRFPKGGGAPETITTPKSADGIGIDADGNLYVATSGDAIHTVVRLDKASSWAEGVRFNGIEAPDDVEVSPDGTIYVADARGAPPNVKRFDASGKLLKSIKLQMAATAGAGALYGIGVDPDCNLWATNPQQRNAAKYSPAGKLLATATSGDMVGTDIAIGPNGDLYIYDINTQSVVRFAENRAKPQPAAIPARLKVTKGAKGPVVKVTFALTGVSCPAVIPATATLKGAVSGKATGLKLAAGKTNVIEIPVAKAASGKATFTIVLKTNGRPTTQVRAVTVG